MIQSSFLIAFFTFFSFIPSASAADKLFRDLEAYFSFVYPNDWALIPSRGVNIRASVTSDDGRGLANCNFGLRPIPELSTLSRSDLESETEGLFSKDFFDSLFGNRPFTKVLEFEEGKLNNRPAGFVVVDSAHETAGVKIRMLSIQAISFTFDGMITIHCGAEAQFFDWYKDSFIRIIRSLVFEDFYR